jgi:hypothetical protein
VHFSLHQRRHQAPFSLPTAVLLACAIVSVGAAWAESAADDAGRPSDVAQVLFGIISYVRWPVPQNEVRVCLLGAVRHGVAIVDKPASSTGQRIRVSTPATHSAFGECDVVFLGPLPDGERSQLLTQIIGKPILSISEPGVACQTSVMFCLRLTEVQIGFEVNLDAIARSGLRVHPNALQIARRKLAQP